MEVVHSYRISCMQLVFMIYLANVINKKDLVKLDITNGIVQKHCIQNLIIMNKFIFWW